MLYHGLPSRIVVVLRDCVFVGLAFGVSQIAFAVDFAADVLPILKANCDRCHGADLQEGGIRLDTLSTDLLTDRAATEYWHEVLNVLDAGEMPPSDEPALTVKDHELLTTWLSAAIKGSLDARRKTDGRGVIRRLNRIEYQNTASDLLGLEMDYARDLPPDAISSDGFQNDGRSLQMSPLQLEYYLSTARRALDRVIVAGEKPAAFDHTFTESKIDTWLGDAVRSNRLGRQQEFLAKIVNEYPDDGDFLVRIRLSAELKPDVGYPLLEVSVGYQPDTEILLDRLTLLEIKTSESQILEFRGRLENFPLPVRGQGKFPGLVLRLRNLYDDKSQKPAQQKDENGNGFYPDEPHLPKLVIESLEFHGNAYDQWPPDRHQQILHDTGESDRKGAEYVRDVLTRFMTRAFRRDVEENEVARLFEFYQSIRPEFPSFEESIRETLAMVLIQPDFLFRIEPAGDEKRAVSDVELASRLSYFLWSTMPDQRLMELASAGKLREADTLASEVDRMLIDKRSDSFVRQFTDQWLSLNLIENIAVNRDRYPDFEDSIKQHMCDETRELFAELIDKNLSALNLLSSDFTMLNEPLAKHYGIEGVHGQEFQKISLPSDQHRGGLLSHASILLINSTGADSHPVRRAVWIRDRLLNDPPAPPPPNIPSLEDADTKFHELSVREQLEIHRTKESCNRCHKNIDPWGIALENFDAVGKWRTETQRTVGDKTETFAVNATETLPDGHEVVGVDGLKDYLVTDRKRAFADSLVSRLLTYAMGRSLELGDQEAVATISNHVESEDFRMKDLIKKVISSETFQTK